MRFPAPLEATLPLSSRALFPPSYPPMRISSFPTCQMSLPPGSSASMSAHNMRPRRRRRRRSAIGPARRLPTEAQGHSNGLAGWPRDPPAVAAAGRHDRNRPIVVATPPPPGSMDLGRDHPGPRPLKAVANFRSAVHSLPITFRLPTAFIRTTPTPPPMRLLGRGGKGRRSRCFSRVGTGIRRRHHPRERVIRASHSHAATDGA